ncbi:MAG: hypothetical protein ACR2RD_10125 [Woeseiaceae bacterium]
MSSYIKASQTAADRPARTKFKIDNSDETKLPVVKKIDVASLEIDDSYDLDCDPYNSTGQHLVDAVKEKFEE